MNKQGKKNSSPESQKPIKNQDWNAYVQTKILKAQKRKLIFVYKKKVTFIFFFQNPSSCLARGTVFSWNHYWPQLYRDPPPSMLGSRWSYVPNNRTTCNTHTQINQSIKLNSLKNTTFPKRRRTVEASLQSGHIFWTQQLGFWWWCPIWGCGRRSSGGWDPSLLFGEHCGRNRGASWWLV